MIGVGIAFFLYIAKAVIIGCAISVCYIKHDLFPGVKDDRKLILGLCSYPLFSSVAGYILGLIFVGWSNLFFYIIPCVLSLAILFYQKNYRIIICAVRELIEQIASFIKGLGSFYTFCVLFLSLIISSIFVWRYNTRNETSIAEMLKSVATYNKAGIVIIVFTLLCGIVSVGWLSYQIIKNNRLRDVLFMVVFLVSVINAVFIGLSFNGREISDVDRSHYELEASYFSEDRNSWEIDNYTEEKEGSSFQDDHGPLWITFLAEPKGISSILRLDYSVRVSNFAILCVYIAFTFLMFCIAEHVADSWHAGAMSICIFQIYRYDIYMLQGSRDAFRFVSLIILLFFSLSCFDLFVSKKTPIRYYIAMSLLCFFCVQGHAGNVYLMLGMFAVMGVVLVIRKACIKNVFKWSVSVLVGTLIGIFKNISIYLSTGGLKHYGNTVFLGTPVAEQVKEASNNEYTWIAIWETYTWHMFFIMGIGIIALILLILKSWTAQNKKTMNMCLLVVGLLLPLTGIMDWIGYECSRYFVAQPRYRMYFLILAAIMASIYLCQHHCDNVVPKRTIVTVIGSIIVFMVYLNVEEIKIAYCNVDLEYRNIMAADFMRMSEVADQKISGDIFVENQILMYYLPRRTKLLCDMYSFDLIQAKTDDEVKESIKKLGLGAVILPYNGIDSGTNYALLPFWDYINNSSDFNIIDQNEWEGVRGYRMFVYVGDD